MTNINEIVSFITSCNDEDRKTVKLDCGDQGRWSVSPTFLTLIK